MFRYILDGIVVVVIITLLRSVIGVLLKLFGGIFGAGEAAPASPAQNAPRPSMPAGGELKKDPVCGTFIAAATSIQKKIGGETYYFCSVDCRDKFRG